MQWPPAGRMIFMTYSINYANLCNVVQQRAVEFYNIRFYSKDFFPDNTYTARHHEYTCVLYTAFEHYWTEVVFVGKMDRFNTIFIKDKNFIILLVYTLGCTSIYVYCRWFGNWWSNRAIRVGTTIPILYNTRMILLIV